MTGFTAVRQIPAQRRKRMQQAGNLAREAKAREGV